MLHPAGLKKTGRLRAHPPLGSLPCLNPWPGFRVLLFNDVPYQLLLLAFAVNFWYHLNNFRKNGGNRHEAFPFPAFLHAYFSLL